MKPNTPQTNPFLRATGNVLSAAANPIGAAASGLASLFSGKKAGTPNAPVPTVQGNDNTNLQPKKIPVAKKAPAATVTTNTNAGSGTGGTSGTSAAASGTPLAQVFNSTLAAANGYDPNTLTEAANNLASTENAYSEQQQSNMLNKGQTAEHEGNQAGVINDYGNYETNQAANTLNAATANRTGALQALDQAGTLATPQKLSPTDLAYSPLSSIPSINGANTASAYPRVATAGYLAGIGNAAGNAAGNQVNTQTIGNLSTNLTALFPGYSSFGVVPLTEWKNKIGQLTSNGTLASIQTQLEAAANLLPQGGDEQKQLQSVSGNLANSDPATIQQALQSAQAAISAQNSAIGTVTGLSGLVNRSLPKTTPAASGGQSGTTSSGISYTISQ